MNNTDDAIMISVLMPVYNVEKEYLEAAIESILMQTYKNFELIIVDDASDDETQKILASYSDRRIRIIRNSCNMGITKSLNNGLKYVMGKYVARMDADDICERHRFEKQLKYMEKHPEVVVLGGVATIVGREEIFGIPLTKNHEIQRIRMSFANVGVIHPTAFIRTSILKQLKYDESILKAQDYELWTRCIEKGKIEVLPEVILNYRVHENQISSKSKSSQMEFRNVIVKRMLNKLGDFGAEEQALYIDFVNQNENIQMSNYYALVELLYSANQRKGIYNDYKYKMELRNILYQIARKKKYKDVGIKILQILFPTTILYLLRIKFDGIRHKIEHNKIIQKRNLYV